MSGTRIKVLFPIDENVPMNKCYEATSNESMYNASTLDVLEDEAEKGHTLRDCLHSGNECLKNKVLEYIYDTIVNMFNCTFENTNDGITGTDGLYAVSETFDKSLCNILGEDVPDSILQIALDMQTDNLTAVENKLEKMQVLGAAKAENYTAEEIREKVDYEIEDDDIEYFRRSTCYDDIFETLAFDSWLYNHDTDVPFVTFALQGIRNEAERYRYLQWLKDDIMKI